ncbi:MAG TPA: hypothetical protein VIV11_36390, partial [Kofleriaceae bacterium]
MMKHVMLMVALSAVGCDAGARPVETTVTLTSVAFADDCGGTPPTDAPALPAREPPAKTAGAPASPAVAQERVDYEVERRRCEQTSMQLAIVGKTADELRIKSVEVFDDRGKSLGKLTASKPTRWDVAKAAYEPWDGKVVVGAMAVSYVLSQPTFVDQWDARDRT